jgi:hypothetical protein
VTCITPTTEANPPPVDLSRNFRITCYVKSRMKIRPDETELQGKWVLENGTVAADDTCRRIELLTKTHLRKIKADDSGWNILYQDPEDGRYWELTYPQSEMHGGGPPNLRGLSREAAKSRYGELRDT